MKTFFRLYEAKYCKCSLISLTFGLIVSFLMLLLGTKVSLAPPIMPPESVVICESSRLSNSLLLSRWRAGERSDIGLNLAEGRMFSL